jgi:hypothetical protein
MDELNITRLEAEMKEWISDWEKIKQDFVAEFNRCPSYALSWSLSVFEHCAKYELAHKILGLIEQSRERDDFKLTREILDGWILQEFEKYCCSLSQSSSATSNLFERAKSVALSKLKNGLDFFC